MQTLTRREARQVAVRAQSLTAERPTEVVQAVTRLSMVPLEPTAAVAPNVDVVLWSRIGASYRPQDLLDAQSSGALVEVAGRIMPAAHVAEHRAEMAVWGLPGSPPGLVARRAWVEENAACRDEILELLRQDGPLPARDLPDTCVVPWRSSGWNAGRNVRMMLQVLAACGEVLVVGSQGRDRLWDLAVRHLPDDPLPALQEARRNRSARALASLGIVRMPTRTDDPAHPALAGTSVQVEGLRGTWRVDPEALAHVRDPDRAFRPRTALLSPLDRLVFDRARCDALFDFDFQLEQYKPREQRIWGYWAMPVLHGEELIGKVDATADRPGGVLLVDAIHRDHDWSPAQEAAVADEIAALASWLDLAVQHTT